MEFEPKMPGGVRNPHASDHDASQWEDGSSVAPHTAPDTSHILEFKYLDIRAYPALKRFPGLLGEVSILFVTFKGKNNQGVGPTYSYGFSDPDAGLAIYDRLVASPHPYGQVLYPDVIKAGVPYTRN